MEPANEAVSPNAETVEGEAFRMNFCLAKPGEVYLIFSLTGGPLTVTLTPGNAYRATQVDPRTGDQTDLGRVDGGDQTLTVSGKEHLLLIQRTDG